MTEEFLQYIWNHKLFRNLNETTDGKSIEIISTGHQNTNAGPDFINARIKIANTLWAGNVEIHINSSDWYKHKHNEDKAYNNVILHIVYNDDTEIYRRNGEILPAVVIKDCFDETLYKKYKQLSADISPVPCANMLVYVDAMTKRSWYETLLIERLQRKVGELESVLNHFNNDWEVVFYQFLARNFGFKVNSLQFELLAKALPFNYLLKCRDNLFQLEALLFGQAGLLEKDYRDEYPQLLKKEYLYLKQKFSLIKPENIHWKFLRTRPSAFPSLRLAQFAALISGYEALFSKCIETSNIKDFYKIFDIKSSDYWREHYIFDKKVSETSQLSKTSIDNLLINTIAPFVFVYYKRQGNYDYSEKTVNLLLQIAPEKNKIIALWNKFGIKPSNAFESQALIELKNEYCFNKKCLHCRFGSFILKLIDK
ncbi:MAG: DUF2851 family protein [Bacteroidales bacterium]|nr:DUF2851 family protein [Bacteroidales bacterium]